ncbi:MAG: DUF2490 domain-containing protein [Sphingobacteriaceae bacterium]|nr:DUF2490 domain-containing protein [Sphingobacteriaceae bacterium]
MYFRFFLVLSGLFAYSFSSLAQSKSINDSEVWPQFYFQAPINSKWSVAADYSHRYSGLFESKTQWIGRVGLSYIIKKNLSLSAGYAYSEYFPASGIRRENRPWQQVQVDNSFRRLKLNHRLRLEERFIKDKSSERFNYRLRYQILALIPVLPGKRLSIGISDEVMINAGNQVSGNKFDQNRLQAGLQIKLANHVFLNPAYLYTYQIQSNKKDFRNIDIVRAGIIYKRESL